METPAVNCSEADSVAVTVEFRLDGVDGRDGASLGTTAAVAESIDDFAKIEGEVTEIIGVVAVAECGDVDTVITAADMEGDKDTDEYLYASDDGAKDIPAGRIDDFIGGTATVESSLAKLSDSDGLIAIGV